MLGDKGDEASEWTRSASKLSAVLTDWFGESMQNNESLRDAFKLVEGE
jgi:hypothetical protein